MMQWFVIYPCGDRSRLAIAQVRDYEKSEWDIAYEYGFENTYEGELECREKMKELAEKHSKRYSGQRAYLR